jgi:hypothetical protein
MTPHRHWVRNYTPYRVPIKLADNTIVYSAGVGFVRFKPVMGGKETKTVDFTRVLHVPDLRNNLLAVLYLTRHCGYKISIDSSMIHFRHDGKTMFTACINAESAAFLNGTTDATLEYANVISTLPLDYSLWHRRLAHHNHADVKKMIQNKMVTGVRLQSTTAPDPICEPCLAGKMHANPFPLSTHRQSTPLALVHSDIHGPLPVRTHSGYRYWVTYIDDAHRFWVVYLIKNKSDQPQAFKLFQAYAE